MMLGTNEKLSKKNKKCKQDEIPTVMVNKETAILYPPK
ncbi:hypothetical protein T01_14854 [Trichinella spiralis]|uniref:Uncharacterized protein n=1 Tax=Trichinella spiralis TaxID=6334 RepID=A0A0V0YUA5_TRISP|nr:hypothetical protein T01_14854 [Trichinella spiralis]